ncbi:MAG: PepSY domain-containing protein [candidate division WOR-3 bacterium]|nr:PepSY domain-containing protein [candidate division WOR-3 bacterium]
MKKLNGTAGTAAVCLALTALFCATALAEDKTPEFKGSIAVAPHAKQTLDLARVTLMEAFAVTSTQQVGQAVEAELGVETGFLVYGFDFLAPSGAHTKVLVDAGDGKVLVTFKEENDTDSLQVEEGDGDQTGDHQDGNDEPDLTAADAAKAKVSLTDAVKTALAAAPGKAVAVKLDSEKGTLIYEVGVLGSSGEATSVAVNATTGKIAITEGEKENGGENENDGEQENGEEEGND